jgi:hypothetical protein
MGPTKRTTERAFRLSSTLIDENKGDVITAPPHIECIQCLSYIVHLVQIKIDNIVKIRKLDKITDGPSEGKQGGEIC